MLKPKFYLKIPALFIVAFSFMISHLFAQTNSPVKEFVTDETNTLSSSEKLLLNQKLKAFQDSTSNQIVVIIIQTTGNEDIESYAQKLGKSNKIGQKEKNNGILLLIAMADRNIDIEVGYGLEGAVADIDAKQIIDKVLKPKFKENKYYEGINAGIDALISATKGEYKSDKKKTSSGNSSAAYLLLLFVPGFIFLVIIISIIKRFFGGGGRWSSGTGGSGWTSGGFFGGGGGSSWSSGSDSGFSGFSGGGGDFGGGGASGSW